MAKQNSSSRLASLQRRVRKARETSRQTELAVVRKAALLLGAGVIGGLQRAGVPNSLFADDPALKPDGSKGFPWKLIVWPILLGVEAFADNEFVVAVAGGLGDATLTTYADRAISTGGAYPTWNVAGELP